MKSRSSILRRRRPFTLLAVCAGITSPALAVTKNFTGTGGASWGTSSSWNTAGAPTSADSAQFTDTASFTIPGEVTSVLDADRTITGLIFDHATTSKFHTVDFDTRTLTVNGNVNINTNRTTNTTTTLRNGHLIVNNAFAGLYVARTASASASATGDLTGLSSLNFTGQEVLVGSATVGSSNGTLNLPNSTTINATRFYVASGVSDSNGTVRFGLNTNIQTPEFRIARDNSTGTVTVPTSGATFTLGSTTQRTSLVIGASAAHTNSGFISKLDLTGATVNLFLSDLTLGLRDGGSGNGAQTGNLFGGAAGSVSIGVPGNTSNIYIGRRSAGGIAGYGTADFSSLSNFSATVANLWLGTGTGGLATGRLNLATTSSIDALSIRVGENCDSTSYLDLGLTNTILANELMLGKEVSNGIMTIRPGGTLNLGSPARRTALVLGQSAANTNASFTGRIDLTGATSNLYFSDITAGWRNGGSGQGTQSGILNAGVAGSVDIGIPGNNSNVYIGRWTGGGGTGIGDLDFSGLNTFTANVANLALGTSSGTGPARGTLRLADTSTIDALNITVGSMSFDSSVLVLGRVNTILANQITIAHDNASGSITIPAGGSLTLGSPSRLASVSIGTGGYNDASIWHGVFNLTGATLTAHLDSLVVGAKTSPTSNKSATFTVSDRPDNFVSANTIVISGGTNSMSATFNFGGGQLFANSITRGPAGSAGFNWTGGTISIGSFGTATTSFNLSNGGTGTLAPGSVASSIGTTQVFGNYTQSSTGTLAIDIAGSSPTAGNDLLAVTGTSTFGGTLKMTVLNGFTPTLGQNFLIATHASRTGTFSFVQPPGMPAGVAFTLDYTTDPTQLMLRTATPVAQNWVAGSGTFGTASNWAAAAVPGTTGDLSIVNNTASAKVVTVGASTTVHRILVQGNTALANLEVPAGVQLGVANQINLVGNALLSGGGKIYGSVVVGGGGGGVPGVGSVAMNGGLTIDPGASVKLTGTDYAGDFTGRSSAATLANAGLLDVGATGLVVATAVEADIRTQIKAGRNAGTWTGVAGITSTAAIADPANRAVGYNVNGAAITVAQTVPGDSNLDGLVNVLDRGTYLANVGQTSRNWQQADWNYDDIVNVLDRGIYLGHVGQSLPTPPSFGGGAGGSSTPMLDGPVGGPVAGNTTPGDGVPAVTYDPTTGKLMLDTDGLSNINAIFLPVSPQSRFVTVVGDIDGAAGANWSQFYAGGQNWESALFTPAGNLTMGTWELATMQTGLSASVFSGGIQFILQNGNLVNTTVEVVPEPTGLALAAMAGLGLLARRRRK